MSSPAANGTLVPRPPPATGLASIAAPAALDDKWAPSKPFEPSADYVSPRRPPSAVSGTRFVKTPTHVPAAPESQEDRRRVAIEAEENRLRTALWLKALTAERDLEQPSLEHVEVDHRATVARAELQERNLVLRAVEAKLDAFTAQRNLIALTLSTPLLNEHRRGAEAIFATHLSILETLAVDFLGVERMAAIAADSALVALLANNAGLSPTRSERSAGGGEPLSPRREVVIPRTAAPPSAMFHGDVGGGRLRWSEEKQWRQVHRSLLTAMQQCEQQEIDDRSAIVGLAILDHAKLHQDGMAQYYAAQREEAARLEREDIAVYKIKFTPEADDATLERDPATGLPTAQSIRERKCLLRLQRCARGFLDRRANAYPLYRRKLEWEALLRRHNLNASVIQRMVRGVLARVARRRRATRVHALESIRLYEEKRDTYIEVIQQFAHQWIARHETKFRIDAPHQTTLIDVQNWLNAARTKYVDDEACGDAFLLPVLARPTQPEETIGVNLSGVLGVEPVLVSSDEDLDKEAFTSHWTDFFDKVEHSRVFMVGIDAEWVGDNHPSLIQIADTKRCFLFRSHRISMERLKPLLQPLLVASNVFKCGVGVRHDRKKLEGMGLGPIVSLLDLVNVVAAVDMLPDEGRSLEQITRAATGLPMYKKKSVTVSNWEAPELSAPQLQYGADDAVAGLAILAAAIEKARQLKLVPPARHSRWAVADDDAVYMWLHTVASMKPPPIKNNPARNGGNTSSPPPAAPSAAAQIAAMSVVPAPLLPGPDDIRLNDAKPKYDNIRVFSMEGKHIFTCDMKKALWYTKKKKLAAVTGTNSDGVITDIQLNFEPAAKTKICMNWQLGSCAFGNDCLFAHGVEELVPAKNIVPLPEDDPVSGFGTPADAEDSPPPPSYEGPALSPPRAEREILGAEEAPLEGAAPAAAVNPIATRLHTLGRANACTICLVTGAHCSKFAVVPSYFRRHIAMDFRRARSLDYVLVCSQCLPRVHATYNAERKRLWEQAVNHLAGTDRSTRLSYSYASKLFRYCEMLATPERMAEIPAARRVEIEDFVMRTFPRSVLPNMAGGPAIAEENLTIETLVQYVTSYELQDWTHSTEAMDVTSHWRDMAQAKESLMPKPRTAADVEVEWSINFIRHWRRIFETQLRPVLVPWAAETTLPTV